MPSTTPPHRFQRALHPLACALAIGLASFSPPGAAAPEGGGGGSSPASTDPAKAFKLGLTLWEAGEFASALPLFERAVQASSSPNARLYVARCLRDLGRIPEAYDEMLRTVKDASELAEKEERYVPTRDTATTELAQLERQVGKVIVVVHESLVGAPVQLNGTPLPSDRIGQPVSVVAGEVSVIGVGADGSTVERRVEVAPGAVVNVSLAPGASTAAPVQAPGPPTGQQPDDSEGFGLVRALGIGVAAVGVAGFVTFAVTRANRDSDIATLEDECGAGPCTDPAHQDVIDSGKTAETIGGVGLGVGIAGVLAGTAMIIFGGPSSDDATAGWAPTADGIVVRF